MKRIFSLCMAMMLLLGVLAGCQGQTNSDNSSNTTETTVEAPTQSAEEKAVLKVLTIGNSHSLDATHLLYEVFQKEAPDQKVVLGTLYYSGCNMKQHADFINNNTPAYEYYKNDNGIWKKFDDSTVQLALSDEQWDVVVVQQMNHRLGNKPDFDKNAFLTVVRAVLNSQTVKPTLAFHIPWTNPDDYSKYLDDEAPLNNPDPKSWRKQHEDWFAGTNGKYDQRKMYDTLIANVQEYLVDSTGFLGDNYFDMVIPSITALEYAQDCCGLEQDKVYRDYTHLSDYGRLIASYLWYAQLMNLSAISEIKVDAVPRNLHQFNSLFPAEPSFAITQEMKIDIVESVNWALAHPYELPAQ